MFLGDYIHTLDEKGRVVMPAPFRAAIKDEGGTVVVTKGPDGNLVLFTEEKFREVAEALPGVPLLANMTEFGRTPYLTADEFEELGYKLVIWPVSSLRVASKAQGELYATLAEKGSAESLLERMQTRQELYDTIDLAGYEELDAAIVKTVLPG